MNKVYWITGLSGAGKTTIGQALYNKLKEKSPNIVLLDGDIMRQVMGEGLGYSLEDRHLLATRYSKLCKMLSDQDLIVICCTISMFHDVRAWNKANIQNYMEIYINPDLEVLQSRNKKGLYSQTSQTAGIGIAIEKPQNPHLTITNNGQQTIDEIVQTILRG